MEGKRTALINVGFVPVRRNPSHKAQMVTEGLLGEEVEVIEKRANWLRIKMIDGYRGWVDAHQVTKSSFEEIARWKKNSRITIIIEVGTILKFPRNDAPSVRVGFIGCTLPLLQERRSWFLVMLPDGTRGWLKKNAAKIYTAAKKKVSGKDIVKTVRRFSGIPYLWGGRSPGGFDCSGLVQRTYELHGIQLPRDVIQQYKLPVPLRKLSEQWHLGDLVFFGEEKPTHVGIYTGRGHIIHARGFVHEQSIKPSDHFFSDELRAGLIGAKTVLQLEKMN